MSTPDSNLSDSPRGVYVEKPKANVYTAMLILSFLALVVGCIGLSMELATYDWQMKP